MAFFYLQGKKDPVRCESMSNESLFELLRDRAKARARAKAKEKLLKPPVTCPGESSKGKRPNNVKNLLPQSALKEHQDDDDASVCVWNAAPRGQYMLNVYGCTRGYGAIIRDDLGRTIAAASGVVSPPVSVFHYYLQGVEKGLQLAINCKCSRVRIELDSLYIVSVLRGSSTLLKVHQEQSVYNIIDLIRNLASEMAFCSFGSCPSECNEAAKYLSHSGGSRGWRGGAVAPLNI
ncbi:hypothetical protein ACHQM5_019369 [Ranunculus cassubicifolius]